MLSPPRTTQIRIMKYTQAVQNSDDLLKHHVSTYAGMAEPWETLCESENENNRSRQ